MNNKIYPSLWFNGNAKEVAQFYCETFPETSIKGENHFVLTLEMSGQKLMLINGGPEFTINPSISFYMEIESESDFDLIWGKLIEGGSTLMPLDRYDWSPKYGWLQDKYGVNWQLTLGKSGHIHQTFVPVLMFTSTQNGNAEKAIEHYSSIFHEASTLGILRYQNEAGETNGNVKHAQFSLNQFQFMAMDSSLFHDFCFNEAISLVVECDTQHEINHYWDRLSAVPEAEQCGWLKDQFGISWQIIPAILQDLMNDPEKAPRVSRAFMMMKKFDIEKLINA
jgi:predicted 3-demethylubiquinone-9 3-methyltransferase (glyoxalase superfamily)